MPIKQLGIDISPLPLIDLLNAVTNNNLVFTVILSEQTRRFHHYFVVMVLGLFLLFLLGAKALLFAQEFENLDGSYTDNEPAYFGRLELEYLDNERDIEETGYYNLFQKKEQKEGRGSLKLYFLNLDAHYKAYDSTIRIGEDKTSLSDARDNVSVWLEFLEYIYLFAQKRNLDWDYSHTDDGIQNFFENEKASATLQGIGVVLNDWRLGISPETLYSWTYRVDIEGQSAIDEDIEFKTNVLELVKKAEDKQGPFYELGYKKWDSTEVKNDREGSLERTEVYVLLGMGFSKNSHVYLGEKVSRGEIESFLLSDNSEATRKSDYANNVLGVHIGFGEDSSIYVERRFLKRKIDFNNISYENTQRYQEEKLTIGVGINDQISVDLKFGKTRVEKNYIERVINFQSYRYQQTDNLIGISVNMQFSE